MLQPSKAFLDPPLAGLAPAASVEAQNHAAEDLARAYLAARESERRFHEMFDALPAAIYTTDAEGRLTYFNPAAVEFSGRVPQLGTDQWCVSWKLYSADGAPLPHDECPMAVALREGRIVRDVEAIAERPDGTRIWFTPYPSPLRDATGKIIGGINMLVDITKRKKADETMRESEERYRSLVSVITDILWTTDAEGRFVTPQPVWENYTGQTWEDYRNFGWVNALHPDDREKLMRVWNEACEKSSPYESRGRLWHANTQRYRHFVSRATPLFNANGQTHEWVGACSDIEDEIRAEAALRQSAEEARAASRAKDDFLAALSHELRTPLTPVLMIAAASETDPEMPPEAREQFSMIRRNVELEVRLIDDLLDVTRISHGKFQIKMAVADLHQVLAHTDEIVRSEALAKNISLQFALEAPRHHVMGDSARLHQVFWNLIRNALKFTPAGGEVNVTTSCDASGQLIVSVVDTGIGISAESLPRIFDAFEQGEAAGQRRFGGLGLGLAISKAIVEMHGGTIRATSAGLGCGSTFRVSFAAIEAPIGTNGVHLTLPKTHRPLRLLMVEDHEPTRSVLARLLTSKGHYVLGVGTAREALAATASGGFDVVISDLGLPDGSGLDLMREIRQKQDCFGIALSGYGTEEDVRQTQEAGYFMHLVKPVNFEELCQVLARLPARAKTRQNGGVVA